MGRMPLPRVLARANLVFVNRMLAPLAARLPGLGVLEHVGRTSGKVRRNPVAIFHRGADRYVVALWYGPDAQWVRNVLAAGGCRVRSRGRWLHLVAPRRLHDPRHRDIPWIVRPLAAVLSVDHALELRERPRGRPPA
jgi:deazaflavin-dependent oxidoreductase (nitroreductase family)